MDDTGSFVFLLVGRGKGQGDPFNDCERKVLRNWKPAGFAIPGAVGDQGQRPATLVFVDQLHCAARLLNLLLMCDRRTVERGKHGSRAGQNVAHGVTRDGNETPQGNCLGS
jgi:hypothetical protein